MLLKLSKFNKLKNHLETFKNILIYDRKRQFNKNQFSAKPLGLLTVEMNRFYFVWVPMAFP